MAVSRKGNGNSKANNNGENKEKKQVDYVYGKSSLNFWNKETMVKLAFRKMKMGDSEKELPELVISIYPLDENRKMIKLEDGKYENGYFNMNFNDLLKFIYGVRRTIYPTKKENFAGSICAHISSDTNTGSQLEFAVTDDGYMLSILYVVEGEITTQYDHIFDNDQTLKYYDENGEASEKTINVDVIGFLMSLESALANAGGMTSSLIEAWTRGNGSGSGKYGGTLKEARKVGGNSLRNRVANLDEDEEEADSESEVEEEETEEEEEAPKATKKPVVKSKVTKPTNAKSMKAILDEDDD